MAGRDRAGRTAILDGVQYLRGLAALLVVIAHQNGMMGFPRYFGAMPMPSVQPAANFAVAVFFVISGFIIVTTSLDAGATPAVARREFLRRRAVRILPFLWLCTLGYNILSWAGTGVFDWAAMLRTIVLSPAGELKPNVAWSLRHEALFYLLFAGVMLGRGRWRWLMWLWVAIVPPLFILVYDLSVIPALPDRTWFEWFSVVLMGSDGGAHLQFGVGMTLGLLHNRNVLRWHAAATAMLAAFAFAAMLVVVLPHGPGIVRLAAWSAAAGGIVTLGIVARPCGGVVGRGAMLLGNASFSIYLLHNPVMLILLAAAQKASVRPETGVALAAFLFVAVLLSLLVGIAVHALVERPLIRAIDRRTRPALPLRPVPLIPDGA